MLNIFSAAVTVGGGMMVRSQAGNQKQISSICLFSPRIQVSESFSPSLQKIIISSRRVPSEYQYNYESVAPATLQLLPTYISFYFSHIHQQRKLIFKQEK